MSGSGDLQVETVESGAVSADYKPMPDFLRGGRAGGGTVDPNSLYRINEDGPEIFEMDGKQYLMTGARGGNVISNHAVASESAKEMAALMKRLGVERKEWESALALPVSGAREFGGPVSAGRMYQVNEKRPEVLSMGGRDYLMMGNQSGTVDPNPKLGNTQNININVHVPAGTPAESRRAAGQGAREALAAFQQAQRYA
jgi:SLT domain-containing protein